MTWWQGHRDKQAKAEPEDTLCLTSCLPLQSRMPCLSLRHVDAKGVHDPLEPIVFEEVGPMQMLQGRRRLAGVEPYRDRVDGVGGHVPEEREDMLELVTEIALARDRNARQEDQDKIGVVQGVLNDQSPLLSRHEITLIHPRLKAFRL